MPNLFAYIALLAWGLAALLFYRLFRPVTAATVTLLGAVVLLPANFAVDFRGLPPIDRHVIAGLGALAGYVFMVPKRLRNPRVEAWIGDVIGIQVVCAFITAYTNPDPLHYGGTTIPGLPEYDALGVTFTRFMTIGAPVYLAARLIPGYDDLLSILRVIVFFGLFYLPLVF